MIFLIIFGVDNLVMIGLECLVVMAANHKKDRMTKKILPLATVIIFFCCLCGQADSAKDSNATTPRQRYEALVKEYESARSQFYQAYEKAKTDAEREKLVYPSPEKYADRFLAIAEEDPKDPAALQALLWNANNCRDSHEKTLDLLLQNYLQDTNLARVADALVYSQSDKTKDWLRAVRNGSPHHEVKGHATYSLARNLVSRDPAQAEKLFEEVVAHYSDVSFYRGTAADAAKGDLFEIRNLAIGKVAPDIEGSDPDGQQFKLSDYRGKVVVIDFWGDW